jgi:anti-anti-sigma factor
MSVHEPGARSSTTVWRSEYSFRLDVVGADDVDSSLTVAFHGDLDAITARKLERAAPLVVGDAENVVLDLTHLELVDMTGVREIQRMERHIRDSGAEASILGARPEVQQMLDLSRRSASRAR